MSEFTREGLEPLSTIGNDTPRIDAIERVTGQAKYTRDWTWHALRKSFA